MMLFSADQANEFFGALRSASVEFLQANGLPISQGHKRYSKWEHGFPLGVTEHFTAGPNWKGTVRWLNDGGHNNRVSCQMLILDTMLPLARDIYGKYPELSGLEVVAILMSDGIIPCWHAGWVNRLNFGIENRNAGLLIRRDDDWYWWARSWTSRFPRERLGKQPVKIGRSWWEPYTRGQIAANILVGQMLYCLNGEDALDPRWFLPHSATAGSKMDAGRAFPLHDVRDAVFSQTPIRDLRWLDWFASDPEFVKQYHEDQDIQFLDEVRRRQDDRGCITLPPEYSVCEEPPNVVMQNLVDGGKWRDSLGSVRRCLNLLGYYVPADDRPELDNDTALASYQFQVSMGLKADKIPGRKTQKALVDRMRQFGLWSP